MQGYNLSDNDLWIAATTLSLGAVLVSNDVMACNESVVAGPDRTSTIDSTSCCHDGCVNDRLGLGCPQKSPFDQNGGGAAVQRIVDNESLQGLTFADSLHTYVRAIPDKSQTGGDFVAGGGRHFVSPFVNAFSCRKPK
jgi:hypothetical protein